METIKIGEIELKDIFCTDHCLEIGFEVESIPDTLLETVQKSIEEEKRECGWMLANREQKWSDRPVVIDCHTLAVSFSPDKQMEYKLLTLFHDAEDERLEATGTAYLDLSEYDGYMKKLISDWLFNKFFK